MIALAPERRRRAIGLAVDHIRDVAHHRRVQYLIDRSAIMPPALMLAPQAVAIADGKTVGSGRADIIHCVHLVGSFKGRHIEPQPRRQRVSRHFCAWQPAAYRRRAGSLACHSISSKKKGSCRNQQERCVTEPPAQAAAIALIVVAAVIAYGSLYPFHWRDRDQSVGAVSFLLGTWRVWDRRGDLLANIVLYLPFGFFGVRAVPPRPRRAVRTALPILAGAGFSVAMELAQFHLAGRVTSMGDVYANTIGTALGTAVGMMFTAAWRWALLAALAGNPVAAMLVAAWLGYRLPAKVPSFPRKRESMDNTCYRVVPACSSMTREVSLSKRPVLRSTPGMNSVKRRLLPGRTSRPILTASS